MARAGGYTANSFRRPVLVVNPTSGDGEAQADLAERARRRGIEVIVLRAEQRLTALVDEAVASGADVIGIAGGDGSLAVVAAAALEHDLPFVCIPASTRNHFALDLGLDRDDVVGALSAYTVGVERRIDVPVGHIPTSVLFYPTGGTTTHRCPAEGPGHCARPFRCARNRRR